MKDDPSASIKSEKSKDIRSTNIIAAKGKYSQRSVGSLFDQFTNL